MDRTLESDRTTLDYRVDGISPGNLVATTGRAIQVTFREMTFYP